MTTHYCNLYIQLLESRLKMLRLIHTIACEHDTNIHNLFNDIDTYSLDKLRRQVLKLKPEIDNDSVVDILESIDEVIVLCEKVEKDKAVGRSSY